MKELSLEEAALAWARGKKVEATAVGGMGEFYSISPIGSKSGGWNPLVFNGEGHRFRLAPEPPAKKFQPWNMLEVPVGVLLKQKQSNFKAVLVEFNGNDQIVAGRECVMSRNECFENYEHSIDGGKTWLPCGVEVDA